MIQNIALVVLVANVVAFALLWKRDQNLLYAIFSISMVVLFGLTVALEYTPEWRDYQKRFVQMQIEKETDPEIIASLKKTPIKIKQVWIPGLDIADRCTTCHLAIDDPRFKDAEEPFRYHAAAREHDFAKIACTTCHSGQGRATETKYAHAQHISHWEAPMWELDMVQVSCPKCHEEIYQDSVKLKGAERLIQAREIISGKNEMELECRACHTIRGVGEVLAPELTEFGAKTEHEFELTHEMKWVEGHKDKYNWTYQHFLDPGKITPGDEEKNVDPTIMPNFEFSKEEAHNLTVFVFSLQESKVPSNYQYQSYRSVGREPSFIQEYEKSYSDIKSLPMGQQLFIKSNCWFCHTIDGKGGRVGPNLTHVGSRRSVARLTKFFKSLNKKTKHPMAKRFHFNDDEVEALVTYLSSLE